jgi:hypothetical protein
MDGFRIFDQITRDYLKVWSEFVHRSWSKRVTFHRGRVYGQ